MEPQTAADLVHVSIGTGLSILGVAFGAWAWVVAWGVSIIRKELGELKDDFKQATEEAHAERVHIEGRISHLETVAQFCKNGDR